MIIRISFDVEDVIKIHDDIIENAGGAFGVLNKGLIEFTIERAKGEVIKEEVIEFLLRLAKGELGLKEVRKWIKKKIKLK